MSADNYSPLQNTNAEKASASFQQMIADNIILNALPKHLKQFIVDQNYKAYTPIDHSVWRYVLRQNHRFLIDHAHQIYFEGLEKTGLKVEAVPSIEEMNEILTKIGWAAVTVDGFIPPAAFMEFQQHRVLVIAADMRQIEHIEYTPSPDIIHEAAGHAPVIADPEYAEYLRRFGMIGAKAMSSKRDFELYEAIRKLSILKETPGMDQKKIDEAEADVIYKQENLGKPSEMALLSRLHWWTVEYGLVGELHNPKIYGAGLLSSIGEAATCLNEEIKKIPYNNETTNYAFDITTKQPHLFVTPDFKHLINVLESFADKMAFRQGGLESVRKAIESDNTATCEYSSGLQVSGTFTKVITDGNDLPIYLQITGPANLSVEAKQIEGHGIEYHSEGFGSPIGKLIDAEKPLEFFTREDLANHKISVDEMCTLNFDSGIVVTGKLKSFKYHNDKLILFSFTDCTVKYDGKKLFEPAWGVYDMAVGEKIVSVFSGAADKDAYDQPSAVSKTRVIKITYDEKTIALHKEYQKIRDIREGKNDHTIIPSVWDKLKTQFTSDWLLAVELYELINQENLYEELQSEIKSYLLEKASTEKEHEKLILDGIFLAENPLKYH